MTGAFYQRAAQTFRERALTIPYVDVLARKTLAGNSKASEELHVQLAAIAEFVSAKWMRTAFFLGLERDDLRQEAMLSMIEALSTWNPDKGSYQGYANNKARQAMADIVSNAHVVSVPRQMVKRVTSSARQESINRYKPSTQDAALRATRFPHSVSPHPEKEGPALELGIKDKGYEEVITLLAVEQALQKAVLSPIERDSLRARYALGGYLGRTQQDRMQRFANENAMSMLSVKSHAQRAVERLRKRQRAFDRSIKAS